MGDNAMPYDGLPSTLSEAQRELDDLGDQLKVFLGNRRKPPYDMTTGKLLCRAYWILQDYPGLGQERVTFRDWCESIGYAYASALDVKNIYENDILRANFDQLGRARIDILQSLLGSVRVRQSMLSALVEFAVEHSIEELKVKAEMVRMYIAGLQGAGVKDDDPIWESVALLLREPKEVEKESQMRKMVVADLEALEAEEERFEGKRSERLANYYERRLENRVAAISYHGTKCQVCGFDFGDKYGEHGAGFIEVHHLRPVSSLGGETIVDPKTDMTVLCSNCHRMIHRRKDRLLTPEDLAKITIK